MVHRLLRFSKVKKAVLQLVRRPLKVILHQGSETLLVKWNTQKKLLRCNRVTQLWRPTLYMIQLQMHHHTISSLLMQVLIRVNASVVSALTICLRTTQNLRGLSSQAALPCLAARKAILEMLKTIVGPSQCTPWCKQLMILPLKDNQHLLLSITNEVIALIIKSKNLESKISLHVSKTR